jgi:hypothetical protein
MENMTLNRRPDTLFSVHVGDLFQAKRSKCAEAYFNIAQSSLLLGPLPTFVIAGDNDYYDCPNRTVAMEQFERFFVPFEQQWNNRMPEGVPTLNVERWEQRPQMFRFVHNGIIFMSVQLINGLPSDNTDGLLDEWNARMADNAAWVSDSVETFWELYEIRGMVIFGHALRSPDSRPFFEAIAPTFLNNPRRLQMPVLYIHGDKHLWEIDTKLSEQLNWVNYRDIALDQGAWADPIVVQIAPVENGNTIPLTQENPNQYVLGDGLFRIDRQSGRYSSDFIAKYGYTN